MKTNITIGLAVVLLAGMSINAQTVTATAGGPVVSSASIDAGTSVQVGTGAGNGATATGGNNVSVGFLSGSKITTGTANILLGGYSGYQLTTSSYNVFLGMFAGGANNSQWGSNVMVGHGAGSTNTTGSGNTFIGHQAGGNCATGSGNTFLGALAGQNETGSNKLYIDNSAVANPLIWGDFNADQLKIHGKVGIGGNSTTPFGTFGTNNTIFPALANNTNVSYYNLFVKGGILTEELRVSMAITWADYVFEDGYQLKPLSEVEKFIKENGHLPNIPSAKQVKDEGVELGNMARLQQEKIEELTLYLIQQQKEIEALKRTVEKLNKEL